MEKVCLNQCVPNVRYLGNCEPNYACRPVFTGLDGLNTFRTVSANNTDTVNFRDKKSVQLEKLNKLFPDGGFEKVYNEMGKDLGLDYMPEMRFVGDDDGVMAGGYTFSENKVTMSLSDLIDNDTKIVGIKDGKRTVLTSPKNNLPLFINSKTAQITAMVLAKKGNLGYDKLVVEPLTEEEHRKFIVQKVVHELIHAQQHMVMRNTEDIGAREVLKAWTHEKPKNMIEKAILGFKTEKRYNTSYWLGKPGSDDKISKDSELGQKAHEWLEAVRNYPKVDSPEYETNAIEVDAYNRSAQYLKDKYGWY